MFLGVSTRAFGGKSTYETAELFAECSLSAAELIFCQSDLPSWKYNLCGYEAPPSPKQVADAINIYNSFGIKVCAIGIYSNFWNGKEKDYFDSLRLFTEYCDIAFSCGVKTIATHTGTDFGIPLPKGSFEMAKRKTLEAFSEACLEAEKRGLTVALEASGTTPLSGYGAFMTVSDFVVDSLGRSNMLKYIYCPSEKEDIPQADISLCHIKDKKKGSLYFERFGEGDVDWKDFCRKFSDKCDIPLIFEYVNSSNLKETASKFRGLFENL